MTWNEIASWMASHFTDRVSRRDFDEGRDLFRMFHGPRGLLQPNSTLCSIRVRNRRACSTPPTGAAEDIDAAFPACLLGMGRDVRPSVSILCANALCRTGKSD